MKEQQPIPRQSKHPKRGFAFLHEEHGAVFLHRVKSDVIYEVSTDPKFQDPNALHDVKPSDLSQVYQRRSSSVKSTPKVPTAVQVDAKKQLNAFFATLALKMPYLCDNCNNPIKAFTPYAKRSACAHILPKEHFECIATDEDNILFMGAAFIGGCGCHDKWDATVENRVNMQVYALALERFEKHLKHKLTPELLKRAYTYLNIEWQ